MNDEKENLRREIKRQIDEFLARGGKPEIIPPGERALSDTESEIRIIERKLRAFASASRLTR